MLLEKSAEGDRIEISHVLREYMKETQIVPIIETRVVNEEAEYRATYHSFKSEWYKSEQDAWLEFENWVTATFHSFGL